MSEVRSGSAVPEDKRQVGIRIELSDWLLDFDLSKSLVGVTQKKKSLVGGKKNGKIDCSTLKKGGNCHTILKKSLDHV